MLRFIDNHILYDFLQCQQCGICVAVCPKQAISIKKRNDGTSDIVVDDDMCIRCQRCVKCCPANKCDNYADYFKCFEDKKYFLSYNADDNIRRESSSGGACKTMIIEGLKSGYIDGVYSLRKIDSYPYAEGTFYTKENIPEYDDMPNSVYHSVMSCRNIGKIQKCKRLMLVGTSCQLRAMNEALKGKADEIIRVCIFCKQQKTLDSTRFLAKVMGTKIPENLKFSTRYRGEGWPGIVRVNEFELPWNRAAQIPFGRRLWTVPGCNICGDPFGVNAGADISLMDPWKIRQENDLGETLITVHTENGLDLLNNIPRLKIEEKKFKEIEPALDLKDIWRKQQLVPYFKGMECNDNIMKAGKAEQRQRAILTSIVESLPRMSMLFYRVLCRFPDLRNRILK